MNDFGLRYFAARDRDAIAVIEQSGTTWSRGELLALVDGVAAALAAAGMTAGDALAIVAPNCGEYLAAYLAGIAAGLYVVPVNWHLSPSELEYLLDSSRASAIVAHA